MAKSVIALLALICSFSISAQEQQREFEMTEGDTTYTMKQYVFCLYLSGEKRSKTKEEAADMQEKHLAHINSMAENDNLLLAGPFGDDTEKRGILLFDVATTEEAEAAIKRDPMVIEGRLTYECHPWWTAKGVTIE